MNYLSAFFETDVLVRDDGEHGRTLVGLAVPWNVATPVDSSGRFATKSGTAWESFERGALDKTITESRKGIPLFGGVHPKSSASAKAAGVLVRSESLDEGQVAEFRLLRTYEGDEARENAEARIWTGFSLGYVPVQSRESVLAGRKHFIRQEVRLDHVAFLRNPAYENAELLAMRSELEAMNPAAAAQARIRLRRLREQVLAWR